VVIAIIAVLIGLLLPAVQKVREAGQRTQSMNNLHQISLATQTYHDLCGRLPSYYGYPTTYHEGAVSGGWNFQLLPFLEQDTIFKATYGPFSYSYKYSYSYNGQVYNYNYSYTYPFKGYQAQRAPNQEIKVFSSPLDYSSSDVTAPSSYLANYYPLNGYMKLTQITDGPSNTIFFAEGLSNCQQKVTYDYSQYGYIYNSSYGGKRSWRFDPFRYAYTYKYSYTAGNPAVYNSESFQDPMYAYFSYYGSYDSKKLAYKPFQVQPKPTECDSSAAQALTSAGVLVAMGDGVVRNVSASISLSTWQAAGTPQSGDILGSDW
jgi:type II secretory pathway pseudopilin PulG